ncbi:hypothetical protein XI04_03455 [Bradyrhizobium sp. CCBAU 11430]|uniref:zincin-like metallopeptidase domain-containing protein n=1 Tax=Bradyrhizobium sp. CCBAU 11430 TaxID=1630881 RepID=UPI003FA4613B|nr:hypothetical protein [Bradyrhizobium sp. CCBAU 11430]
MATRVRGNGCRVASGNHSLISGELDYELERWIAGATLAHETTHWTRDEKRLNRESGCRRFGEYAVEELVAELGAAFPSADLELTPEVRDAA